MFILLTVRSLYRWIGRVQHRGLHSLYIPDCTALNILLITIWRYSMNEKKWPSKSRMCPYGIGDHGRWVGVACRFLQQLQTAFGAISALFGGTSDYIHTYIYDPVVFHTTNSWPGNTMYQYCIIWWSYDEAATDTNSTIGIVIEGMNRWSLSSSSLYQYSSCVTAILEQSRKPLCHCERHIDTDIYNIILHYIL